MLDFHGLIFFILGLLFGSFANVAIYRMPKGESVVTPRSKCPSCGKLIVWYDNIPVLSWLLLRGRCRHCKTSISFRYPMVELITGILFYGLYWLHGYNWFLLEHLLFVLPLIICTFIDFDHMILPDEFTLSGIVIGLLGAWLNPAREFMPALYGVLCGGGALWAVGAIYSAIKKQDGIGGGDVKLLAWIGAVLGWYSIPFVVLASSLVGSLVGIFWMFKTRGNLQTAIPFGPYLVLAAIVYIFVGEEWTRMYLQFFFPSLSLAD